MSWVTNLYLQLRLASANLAGRRAQSAVVALVMASEAFLLLVGLALMGTLDLALERNVTATLAGHAQIYSADAPEALQVFGGHQGIPDAGVVPDFSTVEAVLARVPNVAAIVPMGSGPSFISVGNPVERSLTELRQAVQAKEPSHRAVLAEHSRALIAYLIGTERTSLLANAEDPDTSGQELDRATSNALWEEFERNPLDVLDFLDNHIAPLAGDPRWLLFRYLGTDLERFATYFDRLRVVEGTTVPADHRGVLVNHLYREKRLKNPVARELDLLAEEARDLPADTFRARVQGLQARARTLLRGITVAQRDQLEQALATLVPDRTGGLVAALERFFALTPGNIAARHRSFYDRLAPSLSLYDLEVGDTLVLHAVSRSGFPTAARVKVFGTYRFDGLDGFDAANTFNLIDLTTYRTLIAEPSPDDLAEMTALTAAIERSHGGNIAFDDSLFDAPPTPTKAPSIVRDPVVEASPSMPRAEATTAAESVRRSNPFGHAAVILTDPLRLADTRAELQRAADTAHLGLRVVGWRDAAGIVAQYFDLVRIQLYVGLTIILLVALLIINTAIVIAVLARVRELGTLRTMGCTRGFVMASVLIEIGVLGSAAIATGLLAAVGTLSAAHAQGIPASGNVWRFLFGGTHLHPDFSLGQVGAAFATALVLGFVAALYPALLATRVPPVEAIRRGA